MSRVNFGKKAVLGLAALSCAVVIAGNAHMVYVAVRTQPDCVAHKEAGTHSVKGFSAATPSC
jgi:hypothetical protein